MSANKVFQVLQITHFLKLSILSTYIWNIQICIVEKKNLLYPQTFQPASNELPVKQDVAYIEVRWYTCIDVLLFFSPST